MAIRELRTELAEVKKQHHDEVTKLNAKIEALYVFASHHPRPLSIEYTKTNVVFQKGTTPATNASKNQPSRSKNLSSTHSRVFSRH
jgi:hypothetical protein